ncbi:uncharacterized protein LOC143020105 [Oratosquilla oratoria]|uniref:uncharacterized protein LOC143020105 n=1 Tax=Oratosquilla oratoria TaxID=337810 RepID=UPI003F763F3B
MYPSMSPLADGMTSSRHVTLVLVVLLTRVPSGAAAPFLKELSPVLETVADYGRSILGLDSAAATTPAGAAVAAKGHFPLIDRSYDDVHVKDVGTLWDGVVHVPDFLSPMQDLYSKLGGFNGLGYSGVTHGLDQRYGFRLAVPYMGDFQYVRELGPGHYNSELGPGGFEYAGTGSAHGETHSYVPATGYGVPSTGYGVPSAGYGVPSAGYDVPSTGYGVPSAGYGVPSAGYGVPSAGYDVPYAGYDVQTVGGYDDPTQGDTINSIILSKLKNYPWHSSDTRDKPYV